MRVIVIGAGEVGSNIAESLADSHDVVVIDIDGDRVEQLTYSLDVLAIEGDGTALDILEEANVAEADMLIASTDNDEANIVACGTSKLVSEAFTIARVKDRKFLDTWRRERGAFGVDFMVCTNLLAAEAIVRVTGLPAARDVDPFAGGRVQMAEFDVPEESPLAGQTIREADRFDLLTFAAIIHDDDVEIPTGESVIEAGTRIVVIGTPSAVRGFSDAVSPDSDRTSEVVIIGGDSIGAETARLLEDRGIHPRIIERDPERARELAERLPESVVMEHDATDVEFLVREHVDKADLAVVSLGSDERTLLVSLLARQIGTRRTVAVVDTGEYVNLFEAVGVDVAVNPREVTAEEITRFTREDRTENVALIESDRAEVIEIEVNADSELSGRPISESVPELPSGVVIGALTRNGEVIGPRGDTVVEPGDHVIVFVDTDVLDDVLPRI